MAMPMVQIRRVRMVVHERRVVMAVAVRFADRV